MDDRQKNNIIILAIVAGVILFYIPYLARQFMGDDWLWLANAKRAATQISIFWGRPMYGYFRPLNMVIIFVLLHIFGPTAWIFSLINILLHAVNTWLLWKLLGKFGISDRVRGLAAFVFAFYALNASAIEWISVGHDLWVTLLSLLLAIKTIDFIRRPSPIIFLQIWLIGFAALLIKESGFVALGIYISIFILNYISPLRREFRVYTTFLILSFFIYLFFYFKTRTFADRDVELGIDTLINLWYFTTYLVFPLSERIVQAIPEKLIMVLEYSKIIITICFPLILIYIFKKAGIGVRFFILWSLMFISTIAILKWDVGPFTLYPYTTASRFMYTPVIGIAVSAAWLVSFIFDKIRGFKGLSFLKLSIALLYILGNIFITWQVSKLYFKQQNLSSRLISGLSSFKDVYDECDSLIVLTDSIDETPQVVASGHHLQAIMYVMLDYDMEVATVERENYGQDDLGFKGKTLIIGWNNETRTLEEIQVSAGNESLH
jgi:hypothetical protein